jgi:cell division protein FtsB
MATDTIRRTSGSVRTVPGPAPLTKSPGRVAAPRHTRPVMAPGARPAPRTTGSRPRARSPRTPFILLLVGLLGGALVSLLMISTTLAQGAFRITSLQQQNANLARQEQVLSNQVAQASNPALIAKEAQQLGMRPNPHLGFIDLKTGKILVGKPSSAEAAINVPGYTP